VLRVLRVLKVQPDLLVLRAQQVLKDRQDRRVQLEQVELWTKLMTLVSL